MGVHTIRVDEEKSRIYIKRTGDTSREDARQLFEDLYSIPLFGQGASILWDMREGSALALSAQDFYDIIYEAKANRPEVGPTPTKAAIVVSKKVDFGLSQQFLTLWGTDESSFEVFESEEEAVRWLDEPDE